MAKDIRLPTPITGGVGQPSGGMSSLQSQQGLELQRQQMQQNMAATRQRMGLERKTFGLQFQDEFWKRRDRSDEKVRMQRNTQVAQDLKQQEVTALDNYYKGLVGARGIEAGSTAKLLAQQVVASKGAETRAGAKSASDLVAAGLEQEGMRGELKAIELRRLRGIATNVLGMATKMNGDYKGQKTPVFAAEYAEALIELSKRLDRDMEFVKGEGANVENLPLLSGEVSIPEEMREEYAKSMKNARKEARMSKEWQMASGSERLKVVQRAEDRARVLFSRSNAVPGLTRGVFDAYRDRRIRSKESDKSPYAKGEDEIASLYGAISEATHSRPVYVEMSKMLEESVRTGKAIDPKVWKKFARHQVYGMAQILTRVMGGGKGGAGAPQEASGYAARGLAELAKLKSTNGESVLGYANYLAKGKPAEAAALAVQYRLMKLEGSFTTPVYDEVRRAAELAMAHPKNAEKIMNTPQFQGLMAKIGPEGDKIIAGIRAFVNPDNYDDFYDEYRREELWRMDPAMAGATPKWHPKYKPLPQPQPGGK